MEVDATQRAVERAGELGVDIEQVEGAGSEGRVTVGDVEAHAKSLEAPAGGAEASPPAPPPEAVRVVLNPETGLGGYDFGDGFGVMAGEPQAIDHADYEHYRKQKVEVGGVERPVIVKAT